MFELPEKVRYNDDAAYVEKLLKALEMRGGYCPCRLLRNEDTKCICKEFRDAIEAGKLGKCHCGLYELIDSED